MLRLVLVWRERLRSEAIASRFPDFDHFVHVSLSPAAPEEWIVDDMAALTFRLGERSDGAPVSATVLFPPGVVRIGGRLGLRPEEALAFVDSHERIHVALQVEGVRYEEEERFASVVDAAYLALVDPRAEALVRRGGIRSAAGGDFWDELLADKGATGAPESEP